METNQTTIKTETKINNGWRNICIINDLSYKQLEINVNDISPSPWGKGWPKVVEALANRVETDSLGNLLKIDGKQIHLFPWSDNYKLEGSEDFEKMKNGLTDKYREKYYGKVSWKTMTEQEPHIWLQTDEEKKEVADYWKEFNSTISAKASWYADDF